MGPVGLLNKERENWYTTLSLDLTKIHKKELLRMAKIIPNSEIASGCKGATVEDLLAIYKKKP